ncbi:response regulator [Roseobacter sp.]|uniref:response regulator n=1 Tax=Roseobacter sp. TaxID=1907202 RepID=UPI0026012561|nr:response regulator [Roseobacter sp.]
MTHQTILVVDDDPKIRTLLRNLLEDDGFAVLEAENADEVRRIIDTETINLMTLDVHLGADNGIELAREIRQTAQMPIIMVSGRDDVIDRVVGLEVGADDYITKPFHVREVIARIRSVLRRSAATAAATSPDPSRDPGDDAAATGTYFTFDGMVANIDRFELTDRKGEDCDLTSGDFRLLSVFLERPGRVLSRDQLMDLTGGLEWSPLDRTIDNQVARLRKKIERDPSKPRLIRTVRGIGYSFACDVGTL